MLSCRKVNKLNYSTNKNEPNFTSNDYFASRHGFSFQCGDKAQETEKEDFLKLLVNRMFQFEMSI